MVHPPWPTESTAANRKSLSLSSSEISASSQPASQPNRVYKRILYLQKCFYKSETKRKKITDFIWRFEPKKYKSIAQHFQTSTAFNIYQYVRHAFMFFWFKSPNGIGYFLPFSFTLIKAFFKNIFLLIIYFSLFSFL